MENCSVIITAKNAASTLQQSLESLNQQEDIAIELVFINDGSTDETETIIKNFNFAQHISLVYEKQNLGRSGALIRAVSLASHDYIAVLDADDLFFKGKLKHQLQILKAENLDLIASRVLVGGTKPKNEPSISLPLKIKTISLNDLLKTNTIPHSTVVMKKSVANYNPNRSNMIDYELWLQLAKKGKKLGIIEHPFGLKRIHKNQSFENAPGASYAWSAYKLSLSFAKPLHQHWQAISFRTLVFAYHLLPQKLRIWLRK